MIDFSNAPITKKREIHGFLFSKNCGLMAYGRLLAHGRLLIYRVECMMVVYSHMVLYSEGKSTYIEVVSSTSGSQMLLCFSYKSSSRNNKLTYGRSQTRL